MAGIAAGHTLQVSTFLVACDTASQKSLDKHASGCVIARNGFCDEAISQNRLKDCFAHLHCNARSAVQVSLAMTRPL